MGKTSFAMNMVEHAILAQDKPILVFSMEMPADSLIIRLLSSIGRIDQTRIRNGKLEQEDWPKLSTAVTKLKDVPLFIDDTAALTPTEIRSRARRVYRENGGQLGMIMVDYLQLMQVAGSTDGRTAEISEISRSLKAIAKEFDCPMVALSQLNRSLEQRPNKRPVNSDLRESGAIEQDADVIMFIYRDEVYNEDSPDKGIAEIIIGKQRNGPYRHLPPGVHRAAYPLRKPGSWVLRRVLSSVDFGWCHVAGRCLWAFPKRPQRHWQIRLLRNSTKIAAQFSGLGQCSQKAPNLPAALNVA